ncbi:DNA topoisomerase IB [Parasphingorhabdus cellanae]|uniref:DNA topoisomerase n=1 Tax=Parasphingorhabdus cellanae TaxID=2806553 RepID=A0ABX7TAB7_9SPHN|nr:DNA topoisomerase IB [Parasphingorhabdus cellanae]QTD57390.1 DNA topoisomerase IB [Parasphingorhabdus cellanae]
MQTAIANNLIYVSDTMPGIVRQPVENDFQYIDPKQNPIKDMRIISRINALSIPPAYQQVWICPLDNGHIQATGVDEAGRKQYRYHPDWREYRDRQKFSQLVDFAHGLPKLRRDIRRIFRAANPDQTIGKELACAALVRLLDNVPLRIGNKQNDKARGATTLVAKNIRMNENELRLDYIAKGGKRVRRQIKDRRLLQILSSIDDLPGKALFQYFGRDGEIYPLDSGDVNQWLKDQSGNADISAKVFRTWHGSVAAFRYVRLAKNPTIKAACEKAADRLKNTPAICRSSYIHPAIIALTRKSQSEREALAKLSGPSTSDLRKDEKILLRFLEETDWPQETSCSR